MTDKPGLFSRFKRAISSTLNDAVDAVTDPGQEIALMLDDLGLNAALEWYCARQGVRRDQLTIHADRGSAMTAKPLVLLFADLGVSMTQTTVTTNRKDQSALITAVLEVSSNEQLVRILGRIAGGPRTHHHAVVIRTIDGHGDDRNRRRGAQLVAEEVRVAEVGERAGLEEEAGLRLDSLGRRGRRSGFHGQRRHRLGDDIELLARFDPDAGELQVVRAAVDRPGGREARHLQVGCGARAGAGRQRGDAGEQQQGAARGHRRSGAGLCKRLKVASRSSGRENR